MQEEHLGHEFKTSLGDIINARQLSQEEKGSEGMLPVNSILHLENRGMGHLPSLSSHLKSF